MSEEGSDETFVVPNFSVVKCSLSCCRHFLLE